MKEIKNLPASIRVRLLANAQAKGDIFDRVLVRYAIERFLFRLSKHADRDRFVLKGAMLFVTWSRAVQRPTGDLDLLAYAPADPIVMKAVVANICAIPVPDDAIIFDADSIVVEAVREEEVYQGLRVSLSAKLGNARIRLRIDMGIGDAVHPAPREIDFPCLLPDMGVPRILAYPPETVVAEKFEAMVRFGEANSRLKDFNDIWAIMSTFDFEMATLVQALKGTFQRPGGHCAHRHPARLDRGLRRVAREAPNVERLSRAQSARRESAALRRSPERTTALHRSRAARRGATGIGKRQVVSAAWLGGAGAPHSDAGVASDMKPRIHYRCVRGFGSSAI